MLFVGDSTQQQLATAVHNAVLLGGGDCIPQLTFVASDTLLLRSDLGRHNRGVHWLTAARALRPDVLVLSLGPHVSETIAFLPLLRTIRDEFAAHHRAGGDLAHTLLVWRTNLGAGCGSSALARQPKDMRDRAPPHMNCASMEVWDEEAVTFWHNVSGVYVLDLRPLWRRPDMMIGKRADGKRLHARMHAV